jgi:hypothetical protein
MYKAGDRVVVCNTSEFAGRNDGPFVVVGWDEASRRVVVEPVWGPSFTLDADPTMLAHAKVQELTGATAQSVARLAAEHPDTTALRLEGQLAGEHAQIAHALAGFRELRVLCLDPTLVMTVSKTGELEVPEGLREAAVAIELLARFALVQSRRAASGNTLPLSEVRVRYPVNCELTPEGTRMPVVFRHDGHTVRKTVAADYEIVGEAHLAETERRILEAAGAGADGKQS